jgi:hypothetical protein
LGMSQTPREDNAPFALAAGFEIEARGHEFNKGFGISRDIAADAQLAEFGIGRLRRFDPSGFAC